MRNNQFIFVLIVLMGISFVTCSNPIMKEWWLESESKSEREVIVEREVQIPVEVPIEIEVVKDIKILYINYVIFAPDSIYYNAPANGSGPDLTQQRKDLNDTILGEVKSIADQINLTQSSIKIMANGYSNPSVPPSDPRWDDEVTDCQWISNARAEEVTGELIFLGVDHELITYNGYGGTQTIVTYNPDNLASAELNRRVEIIVVEIVK